MFHLLTRILYTRSSSNSCGVVATLRLCSQNAPFIKSQTGNQMDYIKSIDDSVPNQDWTIVRKTILTMRGNLTDKNVDSVMLKLMAVSKNYGAASSFAQYLKTSNGELTLGCINSVLYMYCEMAKDNKLAKEQTQFILDTYKNLYDKYEVLESKTCEQLIQVLCAINEWEKASKVLQDIYLTHVPTHAAYSTLVATFFKLNKKKKALEVINESIKNKRPLQDIAYDEWMKYILRKYKDKKIIAKYMDEIFEHIANNWAIITENTANKIKDLYISMDWDAQFASLRKSDGQCSKCRETMDCLKLSDEEFRILQQNVKDKLIVGSDLLLKSTHDELKRFLDFIDKSAPFDIVLDGLNICYAFGPGPHIDKLKFLNHVVDYFRNQNKKVLLLGRQHMMRWNSKMMEQIKRKTNTFFTENISQDDPYFITAAILSGPHTDIVSKDLLRAHKFNMKDDSLRQLFKRWQWQHQWMIFISGRKGPQIQPPYQFTPCAQKKGGTWHIPYESQSISSFAMVNDGAPDLRSWLCLRLKS